jgi:hypothetical protein
MGAIVEWISLREFARRREVRLSAVQKAIESGRISAAAVKRDGSRIVGIEFHQATADWNANTDPEQAARSGTVLGVPAGAMVAPVVPAPVEQLDLAADKLDDVPAPAPSDKDPHGYYAARAKREHNQAELAELELLAQLGKLVSVDEMRQVATRRYRTLRDKVLNIPDRIAAILAAEKDPARVHAALTTELKRVLHELSDDAHAEAAEGAAERVAA